MRKGPDCKDHGVCQKDTTKAQTKSHPKREDEFMIMLPWEGKELQQHQKLG